MLSKTLIEIKNKQEQTLQSNWGLVFNSYFKICLKKEQEFLPIIYHLQTQEAITTDWFFFFFWLYCSAYGILVSQPRIESVPPAIKAWSPNHWTTTEFQNCSSLVSLLYSNLLITDHHLKIHLKHRYTWYPEVFNLQIDIAVSQSPSITTMNSHQLTFFHNPLHGREEGSLSGYYDGTSDLWLNLRNLICELEK